MQKDIFFYHFVSFIKKLLFKALDILIVLLIKEQLKKHLYQ